MKTVIVVDDDEIFREVTARQLRGMGFNVITEETCDKVLLMIEKHDPVACIIDMVMPGKEGMETMLDLSEIEVRPKIIGVSSTPLYLEMAKQIVADEVLLKPVMPQKLKETLEHLGVLA